MHIFLLAFMPSGPFGILFDEQSWSQIILRIKI